MNIAILIGISKYKSEAPLPACTHDAENMRRLLASTRKYDDIQIIHENTDASQVKDTLRSFFLKHQASIGSIEEALIYFSGHGTYQNDALLCCSDFDANRPASTSISNGELDDLLRSVKPNVAVKIIDACQSGSPYIKDASAGFEKALSKSSLGSFICMASSQQDQSSYATASESIFTARWIDAALTKDNGNILYRDIQAALADSFVSDSEQTPFFVNQGSGLEIFSAVNDEMRGLRGTRIKAIAPDQSDNAVVQLIQVEVEKRDQSFVPHQHVMNAVESSRVSLLESPIGDPIVAKFYNKSVRTDLKLSSIPKASAVASFAKEQSWPKKYFAKINMETYQARVYKDFIGSIAVKSLLAKSDEETFKYETKQRPSSLEATEILPFEAAELSFTSDHSSLPAFSIYLGLVHSITEVMIISSTVKLIQRGWQSRSPDLSEMQWRYQSYPWSTIVSDPSILWRDAQQRGEADIRSYLESLPPKPEPTPPLSE